VKLKLSTLETRRIREDLFETFKILRGFSDVNRHDFFDLSTNHLRGHSLKLFKNRFITTYGKYLFGNRVVDEWNLLTEDDISSLTVNGFKNKLDLHLKNCRGSVKVYGFLPLLTKFNLCFTIIILVFMLNYVKLLHCYSTY